MLSCSRTICRLLLQDLWLRPNPTGCSLCAFSSTSCFDAYDLTWEIKRDKSMMTFEAQPHQGTANIIEKLSVSNRQAELQCGCLDWSNGAESAFREGSTQSRHNRFTPVEWRWRHHGVGYGRSDGTLTLRSYLAEVRTGHRSWRISCIGRRAATTDELHSSLPPDPRGRKLLCAERYLQIGISCSVICQLQECTEWSWMQIRAW